MFIFAANLARGSSRSYCGSEIGDLDIYSPYSFYGGSEMGANDTVIGTGDDGSWGVGHHQVKKAFFHAFIGVINIVYF